MKFIGIQQLILRSGQQSRSSQNAPKQHHQGYPFEKEEGTPKSDTGLLAHCISTFSFVPAESQLHNTWHFPSFSHFSPLFVHISRWVTTLGGCFQGLKVTEAGAVWHRLQPSPASSSYNRRHVDEAKGPSRASPRRGN